MNNTRNACSRKALIKATGLALLATVALTPGAGALSSGETVNWSYVPNSLDDFVDGALGPNCEEGLHPLSKEQLAKIFPQLLQPTQQPQEDWNQPTLGDEVYAGPDCAKDCSCGTCMVLIQQGTVLVMCAACYACCEAGDVCKTCCPADGVNRTLFAHCQCCPPNNPNCEQTQCADDDGGGQLGREVLR